MNWPPIRNGITTNRHLSAKELSSFRANFRLAHTQLDRLYRKMSTIAQVISLQPPQDKIGHRGQSNSYHATRLRLQLLESPHLRDNEDNRQTGETSNAYWT
jgi:hypothetical protein